VCLNAKGCSQISTGQHFDEDNISSLVTNTTSIPIAFTLMLVDGYIGHVVGAAFKVTGFKREWG
jgi:hypothetical protein